MEDDFEIDEGILVADDDEDEFEDEDEWDADETPANLRGFALGEKAASRARSSKKDPSELDFED